MIMNEIVNELRRIIRRCARMSREVEIDRIADICRRLHTACDELHNAWSGSFLGYHANIYTAGLRRRLPGEHFSSYYGGIDGIGNTGSWVEYDFDWIWEEVLHRADVDSLADLSTVANRCDKVFQECKREVLTTLDEFLRTESDPVFEGQKAKLESLNSHKSKESLLTARVRPVRQSRDLLAASQGICVPAHLEIQVRVLHCQSFGHALREVADIVSYLLCYLEQTEKLKGRFMPKTEGRVFIGHGCSPVWRDLKDFVQERLKLDWDEFNREPVAGRSTKERLEEMLDSACIAFLVMTAEDERSDGSWQARANVIHEAGLFQGRLGFERAIILLEEGCTEFSNIQGLTQIRFPKGRIDSRFEDIRRVLEREGILNC
jgi:hypothetical protein